MEALFDAAVALFLSAPKWIQIVTFSLVGAIALSSPVASVLNGWERGLRNAGMTVPRWIMLAQIVINPIAANFDKAGEAYRRIRAALPGGGTAPPLPPQGG